MNQLHQSLNTICSEHLLDEKLLLAPSLRVGQQWLDALSMAGGAPLNTRVTTLTTTAIKFAEPRIAATGAELINTVRGEFLLGGIFRELATQEDGYLFSLQPSSGLIATLYRTIMDLRLASLQSDELAVQRFESPVKAEEVKLLLNRWVTLLYDSHLADTARALQWATEELTSHDPATFPLLLTTDETDHSWLEQQFLHAWPHDRVVHIKSDAPGTPLDQDRSIQIFHATGERNEIREVLRRCLENDTPLDTVELLYTDSHAYLPLIFETAHTALAEADAPMNAIPVTFAEGIPIRFARPARALALLVQWVREQYPQTILVQMLGEGLLHFPQLDTNELPAHEIAALLRETYIGFRESRYLPILEQRQGYLQNKIDTLVHTEDLNDQERQTQTRDLQDKIDNYVRIAEALEPLLELSRAIARDDADSLKAAISFIQDYAHGSNEFDNYARTSLVDSIAALQSVLDTDVPGEHGSLLEWLGSLIETNTIAGAGPRPGYLHVAPILGGGHSGRPNTFIAGMNDTRFPGTGLQDPLLLDHERRGVSSRLPTAADSAIKKRLAFQRLLTRLRGNVTLSFTSRDAIKDHVTYPSPLVLSIYRKVSDNENGDIESFMDWLPDPAVFAPSQPDSSLTPDEWWLSRLCSSSQITNASEIVHARFAHLMQGNIALSKRLSPEFTEFDGYVPTAGPLLSPTAERGRTVSASALETLARCPFQFFIRYGLGVVEPESIDVNPSHWLDASETGTLLHDVFNEFMRNLKEHDRYPEAERDSDRIQKILASHVNIWLHRNPPPTESIYRRELSDLTWAVNQFLTAESLRCSDERVPMYFEAALGMPGDGTGTPLDDPNPITIKLPNGEIMRARGQIDRIDRVGGPDSHAYEVWDYKTGGTSSFKPDDPFQQGRKIQNTLYMLMADRALKSRVHPDAHLHTFGYYFPSKKGQGRRIEWQKHELDEGLSVLEKLCALSDQGMFPHSDGKNDCFFCEHTKLTSDMVDALQEKIEHDDALATFRELRSQ